MVFVPPKKEQVAPTTFSRVLQRDYACPDINYLNYYYIII
jgi:hypothetical protein